MHFTIILFIISFFLFELGYPQNRKKIDSLLHQLEKVKEDTSKINTYLALYYEYHRVDNNQALDYALKAKDIARKTNHQMGLIRATYRAGNAYRSIGQLDLAKKELNISKTLAQASGNKRRIGLSTSGLARVYRDNNQIDSAAIYYLDALEIMASIGDRNSEARIQNELGTLYKRQKQYEKALVHYQKALAIVEDLDFKPGISACLSNIGDVHIQLNNYDKALTYLNEALFIKKETGDNLGASRTLENIGVIYNYKKKYEEADQYFNEALVLANEVKDPRQIINAKYNLAKNRFDALDFQEAVSIAKTVIQQAQTLKDLELLTESHKLLADAYARTNRMDLAYEHSTLHTQFKDSLYNKNLVKVTNDLEAKYQNEQNQKEIRYLKSENELNALQIQKRETERNYLIALAFVILIIASLLYNQYRIKQKSNKKLRELDQLKSNFFANISHEFRTPLTLILGPLEKKLSKTLNRKEKEEYGMMHRNAKRLLDLINQLLDLSKLEAGNLKLRVSKGNIANFLRTITSSFHSQAEQKGITYTIDIGKSNIQGYFDHDKVEKALYNLLSNAFKFTDKGTVTVSAILSKKAVKITVEDTGAGIAGEHLERIFNRFYQSDNSQTRKVGGSGIGLALTRELVELHHGTIEVKSEKGRGSEFQVTLPIDKKSYSTEEIVQEEKLYQAESSPVGTVSGSQTTYATQTEYEEDSPILLVVEDNAEVRSYIRESIDAGFRVAEAKDGKEGLETALKLVPDIIISDLMMPNINGNVLCKKLKTDERTSHIPVILLTARADIDSKIAGLETGADDYLIKPFNPKELNVRIKNLVGQRKKLRERFSRTVILQPKDIAITSADETFLKKVMEIIEKHMSDAEFSVETFQKEIGMSRMQLHRKLTALSNLSASEFIRVQRLKRASRLLKAKNANVSQVAYDVGFSNLSYFAKCFKGQFGQPPSEYATKQAVAE